MLCPRSISRTCLFFKELCLVLLLLAPGLQADTHNTATDAKPWTLRKEENGVQIFSRPVEHSDIQAIKILAQVPASPENMLTLLTDPEKRQQWDELCKEARGLATTAEQSDEKRLYLYYDMPWPVKDRDIIVRLTSSREADGSLVLSSQAEAGASGSDSRAVRVTKAWYIWRLSENEQGGTVVEAEMFMDPAGPIPSWLINYLSLNQPIKTVKKLRELGKQD